MPCPYRYGFISSPYNNRVSGHGKLNISVESQLLLMPCPYRYGTYGWQLGNFNQLLWGVTVVVFAVRIILPLASLYHPWASTIVSGVLLVFGLLVLVSLASPMRQSSHVLLPLRAAFGGVGKPPLPVIVNSLPWVV